MSANGRALEIIAANLNTAPTGFRIATIKPTITEDIKADTGPNIIATNNIGISEMSILRYGRYIKGYSIPKSNMPADKAVKTEIFAISRDDSFGMLVYLKYVNIRVYTYIFKREEEDNNNLIYLLIVSIS